MQPNYELTDIFLKKVEEKIHLEPAYYLWTHKRFKHKDKAQTIKKDNTVFF
jgi:KDO2-lipid IV(A) lauroyltransferase